MTETKTPNNIEHETPSFGKIDHDPGKDSLGKLPSVKQAEEYLNLADQARAADTFDNDDLEEIKPDENVPHSVFTHPED